MDRSIPSKTWVASVVLTSMAWAVCAASRACRGAEIGGVELGAGDLGEPSMRRAAVVAVRRHAEPDTVSRVSKAGCAGAAIGRTMTVIPATKDAVRKVRRSIAPVRSQEFVAI